MKYAITFGAAIVPLVAGHGLLTSPTPRKAGSALESVCGSQIYNNMNSDAYGNIQGETQLIQSDFTDECNLWLCKGFQFSDNSDNVQSYTEGEVVDMTFDIRAPHTGTANVSIVDTATNTVIGDELAYWSVFASNSQADAANETSFSITIPTLDGKCATAGECVIQHYWNSDSAGQTYESCIDFTVGGSSSGGSSSSAAASSSSAAATSAATSVASSSAAAVSTTKAAVSSAAATTEAATSTSKSIADVTSSSAAPTETAADDDSCDDDGEGDDEDETTTSTTVTVAPSATASAPAATETGDDDSCDPDGEEDEEATTTTSAFSAEATGESGDDSDDEDGCDADGDEPASSSAAAVPTTLVTRTSSRAASATPARTSSKAASASATPTSSSGSVALYGQCGGINYTGATSCSSGTCTVMNDYYSQCV
ncbi:hypothetical protein SCAR479_06610 [Seiridium cardinale]|uniref:CBM1 domain-containing protein n=1 Tax=Seiridium cardinale TaxID=138064 RepID=A0ABR2XT62_9PEZI